MAHRAAAVLTHLAFAVDSPQTPLDVQACVADSLELWSRPWKYLSVQRHDPVVLIQLNRPKYLNALCRGLVVELREALVEADKEESIGAIVITGIEKAFAAGADISEMADKTLLQMRNPDGMIERLGALTDNISKPIIAAINGYALGGGCELALMCDIIVAGVNAQFGQPEIKIGTIPGCGGTQRLVRIIGKSRAMEMVLTGKAIQAEQAEKLGLVSKVVPDDQVVEQAISLGQVIAAHSRPVVALCKQSVNKAFETTLQEGLAYERSAFHATFALEDRKEGMQAFLQKRKAVWSHK